MVDVLDELYAQCDPAQPMPAGDPRYVDWHPTVGADDIKHDLANALRRARVPEFRLLTGHRGSGKTSELLRLIEQLETDGFFVSKVAADTDESGLSLDDVRPVDLILTIARQLLVDLEGAGVDVGPPKRRFLEWLRDGFGDAAIGLDFKFLTFDFNLRNQAREHFEPRVPSLLDLVNDQLVVPAQVHLRRRIVVAVDDLDRIVAHRGGDGVPDNQRRLFLHGESTLRGLACSAIYTVPVELAYSLARPPLEALYEEVMEVGVIPAVDRAGDLDPTGAVFVRAVLDERFRAAGTDVGSVFPDTAVVEQLILASGGHLQTLFRFVRTLIGRHSSLPLDTGLERVLKGGADDLGLALTEDHIRVLRGLCDPALPGVQPRAVADQVPWYELLQNSRVLVYHEPDGTRWFAPHPLLRHIPGLLP